MSQEPHQTDPLDPEPQAAQRPAPQTGDEVGARAAADAYAEAAGQELPLDESVQAAKSASGHSTAQPEMTPEQLRETLLAQRREAEESRALALRLRADMENLKRRSTAELEKAHKFALDGFVRELLGVRDSLELGHRAALDEGASVERLREGTELTLKLLTDVMGKFGVAVVDPLNEPFSPELHQAISMQPREDVAPGTVVEVIQKGYTLNGRLVRPAMVLVSQ